MAKLTGPLLSFGARGQIGKTLVTSKWRGVPYARQYVIPANPQTTSQQANRNAFATLREMWKLAPAGLRAPWDAFASGRPFTGMNKFVGENRLAQTTDTDFDTFLASPGARGGIPPSAVAATTGSGSGEIDLAITAPAGTPTGWTLTKAVAVGFEQQSPQVRFDQTFVIDENAVAPYGITLAGFTAATEIVAAAWLEWAKPNGDVAYSPSLVDTATSGA